MVERSWPAYNEAMRGLASERSTFTSNLLPSIVHACLVCQNARRVRAQELGFCAECLDRARIISADEIGGES